MPSPPFCLDKTQSGTPMDVKMVSRVVMVQREAGRGVSTWLSEAEWLKNRVKVAITDLEPFCDSRWLWHTPAYCFQSCKGGDMVCIRGRFGALSKAPPKSVRFSW
jgi:hypothetical protein